AAAIRALNSARRSCVRSSIGRTSWYWAPNAHIPTRLSLVKRLSPPWAAAAITPARVEGPVVVAIPVAMDAVTSKRARVREGELAALHRPRAVRMAVESVTGAPANGPGSVAVESGKPGPTVPSGARNPR